MPPFFFCFPFSPFLRTAFTKSPKSLLPLRPRLLPHRSSSPFSTTPSHRIRTTELQSQANWRDLRANSDRLWRDIHETAKWGEGRRWGSSAEQTGLSRLTLTPSDISARNWFHQTCTSLSCTLHTDSIGNQFAIRPGLDNSLPPVFAGSHLDSQPTGGRFDGVLGVCAGIEMLRVLEENWIETQGPVGVVNWTNEEGARFACSMMGSGVWSGEVEYQKAVALREVTGEKTRTVGEELQGMGIMKQGGKEKADGVLDANWQTGIKMGAHFELHIEQGPHLVGFGQKIGVVEGVQAYRWYELEFQGRDCHTGTTSFEHRADALLAAARAIVEVRTLAEEVDNGALASVGIIDAKPGSVNTVPGYVKMSLDLRCPDEKTLDELEARVKGFLSQQQQQQQQHAKPSLHISIRETFRSAAIRFQKEAVDCVEAAAGSVLQAQSNRKPLMRKMTSGAGHDSVFASKRCPTAMIFVPCRDGVSHHPEEWCEQDDCAVGASVLIEAVLRFDRGR